MISVISVLRFIVIAALAIFYAIYLAKKMLQRRKGIRTNQIGQGKQRGRTYYIEVVMGASSYLAIALQILSILLCGRMPLSFTLPLWAQGIGLGLCVLGDAIFAAAVITMRDSWRAGIPAEDKTELVTCGIFRISRNPAFLGFDCVFAGFALIFFNLPLLAATLLFATMLHLQILEEEKFLSTAFGPDYLQYKSRVRRYFGRKSHK